MTVEQSQGGVELLSPKEVPMSLGTAWEIFSKGLVLAKHNPLGALTLPLGSNVSTEGPPKETVFLPRPKIFKIGLCILMLIMDFFIIFFVLKSYTHIYIQGGKQLNNTIFN